MKDTIRMEETPEGWIEGEGVGEEFDLEFEFVEAEMSSSRVESKRKVQERNQDLPEKKRKTMKRKWEKLVNWGDIG